ncbi:MAG: Ig-like domain-containing protein [Flavobacteriales bacterium]|nr:Ig-like domain-containing protein [Flavobacteriales bacterium]
MRSDIWTPLLVAALAAGCAQVGDITGGAKDEEPPKLVAAEPPHLSTRFTGRRIALHFDERITLDRVRDRLLVSPPLDVWPNVRVSGPRSVTIDLNAPLRTGTTYIFGIGEAVKDLSEGNVAGGLAYVVSTGDVVDSLVVAGRVVDAFTGAGRKEVLVLLHDEADTSTVRTARPTYATRTDAEGRFLLRHLRAGSYRLHALQDMNGNYRYDLPNEEIAFLGPPIAVDPLDTLPEFHLLRMFREAGPVQLVRESKVLADGALRLILARPAEELRVRDVARTGGQLTWRPEWSRGRDTVLLWPSDTTLLGEGRYAVSIDGQDLDTLRYRRVEKMPFNPDLQAIVREDDEGVLVRLHATRPIAAFDRARFLVERDSLPLPFDLYQDSTDVRTMVLRVSLPLGASAALTVLPKGIRDIYGGHNDTLRTGLGRAAEGGTGNLRVRLDTPEGAAGPFMLQLLDAQGRTVREQRIARGGGPVGWERISPGNHGLRLIADDNGNGRWDTGVLDEAIQPERVWQHGTAINVRAGWDLTIDWKLE